LPADAAQHDSQYPAIKVTKPKQAKTVDKSISIQHGSSSWMPRTCHSNTATTWPAHQVTKAKQAKTVDKLKSIMEVHDVLHLQLAIDSNTATTRPVLHQTIPRMPATAHHCYLSTPVSQLARSVRIQFHNRALDDLRIPRSISA